jgi:AcrR family transcriptional regulator
MASRGLSNHPKPLSPTRRDGASTRLRILEAAKARFSQCSFEGVGVRDIAEDAGVDAALVIRYFGSKEALFEKIAKEAFDVSELVVDGAAHLSENTLNHLLSNMKDRLWHDRYDPFRLFLCSISSPVAGPILAACFESSFVKPLARELKGKSADTRAALISAYILGFALMLVASPTQHFAPDKRILIDALLGRALDECVENEISS